MFVGRVIFVYFLCMVADIRSEVNVSHYEDPWESSYGKIIHASVVSSINYLLGEPLDFIILMMFLLKNITTLWTNRISDFSFLDTWYIQSIKLRVITHCRSNIKL